VQDLSPGPGSLAPATLAVNNTLGSQVSPDYPSCCGAVSPDWNPDAFDLLVSGIDPAAIDAANSCTGQILDISGDFTNWFSANPAVALVTTRKVQGVSPGATTCSVKGAVLEGGGAVCVLRVVQVNAPCTVGQAVTLVGENCNANPSYPYGGNYANPSCIIQSVIPVPSGGSCVTSGTQPNGTPKTCYTTNVNGCQTFYCAVNSRIANSACTAFLDNNAATISYVPAGCSL
jgi:hypothetical protein